MQNRNGEDNKNIEKIEEFSVTYLVYKEQDSLYELWRFPYGNDCRDLSLDTMQSGTQELHHKQEVETLEGN